MNSVVVTSDDSIVIGGESYSPYFNGEKNKGNNDIFVVKYSQNLTLIWSYFNGSNTFDYPCGLDLDSVGDVYMGFYTSGDMFGAAGF